MSRMLLTVSMYVRYPRGDRRSNARHFVPVVVLPWPGCPRHYPANSWLRSPPESAARALKKVASKSRHVHHRYRLQSRRRHIVARCIRCSRRAEQEWAAGGKQVARAMPCCRRRIPGQADIALLNRSSSYANRRVVLSECSVNQHPARMRII